MATPVDLTTPLTGEKVTLLERRRIAGDASGTAYSGFAGLLKAELAIRVSGLNGMHGRSLTVYVEQSDDEGSMDAWSTAASHEFGRREIFTAVVSEPKNTMRVRWEFSPELDSAVIEYVELHPRLGGPFLAAGGSWTLYDSSGDPIFRIDESDGSVHVKDSVTLTDDL